MRKASSTGSMAPRRAAARTLLNMFCHAASRASAAAATARQISGPGLDAGAVPNLEVQFAQVESVLEQGAATRLLAIVRDAPNVGSASAPNSRASPSSFSGVSHAASRSGASTLQAWAAAAVAALARYIFAAGVVEGCALSRSACVNSSAPASRPSFAVVVSAKRMVQLARVLAPVDDPT